MGPSDLFSCLFDKIPKRGQLKQAGFLLAHSWRGHSHNQQAWWLQKLTTTASSRSREVNRESITHRALNLIFITCPRLRVTHFRYGTTGPEQGFTFPIQTVIFQVQHPVLPNTPSAIHKPQKAREGNGVSEEHGKLQGLSWQRSRPHRLTCCSSLERTRSQKGLHGEVWGLAPLAVPILHTAVAGPCHSSWRSPC